MRMQHVMVHETGLIHIFAFWRSGGDHEEIIVWYQRSGTVMRKSALVD